MLTDLQTIDDWHQAVNQLASRLTYCPDHEVAGIYRNLLSVLEQTFGQEHKMMEEVQFPALQCHLEQHSRVLAALHHLHPAVMNGEHAIARRAGGKLLPEWFELHRETQDAALGVWVACYQRSQKTSATDHRQVTARHPTGHELPQPYYCDLVQPHFMQPPVRERVSHGHIDPLL